MTGFEPRTSGVVSDYPAIRATTTASVVASNQTAIRNSTKIQYLPKERLKA